MRKWLLTDLHIHTTLSDGTVLLEDVVRLYGEKGFDVIAITDHLFDTESQRSLELYEEGEMRGRHAPLPILPIKDRVIIEEKGMDATGEAKILIVDDERDLVEMLAYNLEKRGYRVIKTYDGFEAWQKIESERPDLLILDLMMPNLDGWELCRMVRRSENKATQAMGILMLTAKAMPEDKVYGLEIGADDYLSKPFSLNELILRVAKLIQKQKTVSQLKEEIDSLGSLVEKKESNLRTLAHDLKSPLISIGFSAKRLLRRHQNEEMTGALKTIYDSSLHLTRWVEETLSTKDLSSSGWQEQVTEVDIKSLVRQAIDLLKESCLEKSIEIQLRTHSSVPVISCHEPLMYRALVNLLSNALKYTPRGGEIEVSIHAYFNKKGTGVLEISIRDTGIGICEEDKEKIFQPYYRGRNASSEEGKGLGLSFVKEVMDLHGGKVLVQSEPNVGSIFSILLPVKDVPQEEHQKIYQEVSSPSNN